MKGPVVIFGANGFLGRYFCRHYARQGREVVAVGRSRDGWSGDGMFLEWDGERAGPWTLALEGADLVLNLAGRSVNCRYSEGNRAAILDSRVRSTRVIGEAIAGCRVPPKLWINSSTATWYRDARDEAQDEWRGEPGEGFSVEVARQWEEAFFAAKVPGATRKIALRIGMVMANEADTVFRVLSKLVANGLGGRMGSGSQRVSWIHLDDLLGMVEHLEGDLLADGVFNAVAPECPSNAGMMRAYRERAGMPLGLPASRWMLGIGARVMRTEAELVLKSRWVDPRRMREAGFRWRWPALEPALADLQGREGLEGFFRTPVERSAGVRVWTPGRGLRTA